MATQVNFKEIFSQLKEDVMELAKNSFTERKQEAIEDTKKLLEEMEEKLRRWTNLLGTGDLTLEDFKFLVNSQKDLVALHALKEAGESEVDIDALKNGLFDTIVGSVVNIVAK
jgi:hypothetical protein